MSFDRLNEILDMPVPPPLPAEQKPVVDDDYLLRRFIGPEAEHYIAIYGEAAPTKLPGKGPGEWNKMRIIARGRRITVELNGETVNDANLDDYKAHEKEHPGLLREKGHLGVQSHDGRVEFRNLFVKPLDRAKK